MYSKKKKKNFNPNVSHTGSFHLHMRRNWRKTGIAVAEECFLEYWNSYIQLDFSWCSCVFCFSFFNLFFFIRELAQNILLVLSIWRQELRGNKKDREQRTRKWETKQTTLTEPNPVGWTSKIFFFFTLMWSLQYTGYGFIKIIGHLLLIWLW